jgi:hypothetical protein
VSDEHTDPVDLVRQSIEAAAAGPAKLHELCDGLDPKDCVRKPGVGKLSLFQHVLHLLEMERDVFGPRIRRVLAEDNPVLQPIDIEEHEVHDEDAPERDLAAVIDAWVAARTETVALVESTTAEQWQRPLMHPLIGKATLLDLIRRWGRHDGDHLRQIEILSLNVRERNLP